MDQQFDVVVVGGGAAGMMCAAQAGQRGRSVLLIEHGENLGEKIRISGGGRCNFTNVHAAPKYFLSQNKHFCISALKQYTAQDFISLVETYGIAYHEKALGQLFCDGPSGQIIDLLKTEMKAGSVTIAVGTEVSDLSKKDDGFLISVTGELESDITCQSLVIATGGKSIPKMGATSFGLKLAEHFGLNVVETRPGLVPFTFDSSFLDDLKPLSGIGIDSVVSHGDVSFREAMLFTHRGLSGPSILQVSSFWRDGERISINLLPDVDVAGLLEELRAKSGKRDIGSALSEHLPKRVAQMVLDQCGVSGKIGELKGGDMETLNKALTDWSLLPMGTEGYRTAEVMLGGVDTNGLNSKTMMVRDVKGLYFIGEVVDVTGWLGGYNFQWAWSSGWVAGQVV